MDSDTQELIQDVSNLNEKMDYIVNFLNEKYDENKDEKVKKKKLYDLVEEKEQKETSQNTRFSSFKRKERQYQAVPFIFDGMTSEGRKQLNKALKNIVPDMSGTVKKTSGALGGLFDDLMAIAAFSIGFLIGVLGWFVERAKFIYELAKEGFVVLENFFKDIKAFLLPERKILNYDELIKGIEETFKLSPEMKEKIKANKEKFFADLENTLKIDPKKYSTNYEELFKLPKEELAKLASDRAKFFKEFEALYATSSITKTISNKEQMLKEFEALYATSSITKTISNKEQMLNEFNTLYNLSPKTLTKITANRDKFFADIDSIFNINLKTVDLNDPRIAKELQNIAKMYNINIDELKVLLTSQTDLIGKLKALNASHSEMIPNLQLMFDRIKRLPPEIMKLTPKELDQYIIELQAANDQSRLKLLTDLKILRKFRVALQSPTLSEAELFELRGYIKKFQYETLKMSLEDLSSIIERLKDAGSGDTTFVKALEELKRLKIEGYTLEELRNLKTDIEIYNVEIIKRKTLLTQFIGDLKALARAITPDFILEAPGNMQAYVDGLRTELRAGLNDVKAAVSTWKNNVLAFLENIKKDFLESIFTDKEIADLTKKVREYKVAAKNSVMDALEGLNNLLKGAEDTAQAEKAASSESVLESVGKLIGTIFQKVGTFMSDLFKGIMKIPGVEKGLKLGDKAVGWIGTIFAIVDDLLPLAFKAIKGEDIPKEMLVTNLTDFFLQMLGLFGGVYFLPLLALKKEMIKSQIENWLNSKDGYEFLGRTISGIVDVAYKAMIATLEFFLITIPKWLAKMFGADKAAMYLEGAEEGVEEHLRTFDFYDLGDKLATGFFDLLDTFLDACKKIFTLDWWISKISKDYSPKQKPIEETGAGKPAAGSEEKPRAPGEPIAGDLIDDGDRMLIAGKDRVTFRKDDEIFAIRKSGPIDKIFTAAFNTQTSELRSSFEGMSTAVAKEMSKNTTRLEALVNYVKLQNEYLANISKSNQSIADTPTQAVNLVNQSVKNNVNIDTFTSTTYRSKLGRAPVMVT